MNGTIDRERYRMITRLLSVLLVIVFLLALWLILRPFFTPILWAAILATTTWPVFVRIRRILPAPSYLAPLATSLLLGAILLVVILPIPLRLASELKDLGSTISRLDLTHINETLSSIPLLGRFLSWSMKTYLAEPNTLGAFIAEHQTAILTLATVAARGVLTTVAGIIASLIGCYLLFRYGEVLAAQARRILNRLGGENVPKLMDTVHSTVLGASYSILATAVAQGALAGLGYLVTDAPVPLLLALTTMVLALIPFGSPLVYIPVSLHLLLFTDLPWYHGVGLAAWGICVVSTVDNILRSILISQTTKLSAILVFIGVLGGVASFGLLGVFIGPAVVAVAQWLWLDLARTNS